MTPSELASRLRRLPRWSAMGRQEDLENIVMAGAENEVLSPLVQYVKADDVRGLIAELENGRD